MSLDTLIKYEKDKKALEKELDILESKNSKFQDILNDMMPYYLRQRIIGYNNNTIELKNLHKYLHEYELKNFDIEADWRAGSAHYTNQEKLRKSIIASVQQKDHVTIGLIYDTIFSIYKEDDYVLIFHRGVDFRTNSDREYENNKVKLLKYKDGDKYANVLVKVLWCNKYISHEFKVNVEKFNEFYNENKHKEAFKEKEKLSKVELDLLLKPASKLKKKPKAVDEFGDNDAKPKIDFPEWLILGKNYISKLSKKSLMLVDFCEKGEVEMHDQSHSDKWNRTRISISDLKPDPADKRELSAEILGFLEDIKKHTFIYSSRNASGAGRGKLRKMDMVTIRAGYDRKGNECIQLPGGDSYNQLLWKKDKIQELVKTGKTQNGWKMTEYTSVSDEVVIGNDRKKMPSDFEWESYGFG